MKCSLLLILIYCLCLLNQSMLNNFGFICHQLQIKVYIGSIKFEFTNCICKHTVCVVVEVWDGKLEDDSSNPCAAFCKKCFSFFTIFDIILLYLIEIKTKYCSSEKLNIFLPSAARRIRTSNLQDGWMYPDHRLLNAAAGITHQCASDWNITF